MMRFGGCFCKCPGEDDTAVVKTWNVRPSLTWKDGIWGPWTDTWNHEVRSCCILGHLLLQRFFLFFTAGKCFERLKNAHILEEHTESGHGSRWFQWANLCTLERIIFSIHLPEFTLLSKWTKAAEVGQLG
jgi:hypothetical protein